MNTSRRHRWLIGSCIIAIVFTSFLFASPTARGSERTFVIEMANFAFLPNLILADPGDVITVRVFNNDSTGHTFDITEFNVSIGTRTSPLLPGQNATSTFTADRQGTFWFFCDIPGHATRAGSGYTGMAGRLIVGQPPAPFDLTIPIVIGVAVVGVAVVLVLTLRRRPGKT